MNKRYVILLFILFSAAIINGCGESGKSGTEGEETKTTFKQIDPQGNTINHIEPPDTVADIELLMIEHDYSGGSAALAAILNYTYGLNLSETDAINGMMTYGDREQIQRLKAFSLYDMQQYVNALDYIANGYNYGGLCTVDLDELNELSEVLGSALVPVEIDNYQHFVILAGYDDNFIYLASPYYGKICLSRQDICSVEYKAIIFIVWPDDVTPISKGEELLPETFKRFL